MSKNKKRYEYIGHDVSLYLSLLFILKLILYKSNVPPKNIRIVISGPVNCYFADLHLLVKNISDVQNNPPPVGVHS